MFTLFPKAQFIGGREKKEDLLTTKAALLERKRRYTLRDAQAERWGG